MSVDNVASIIDLEKRADGIELEADRYRWDAARLIVAELDAGTTQRKLANLIGKGQPHVSRMAKVWRNTRR